MTKFDLCVYVFRVMCARTREISLSHFTSPLVTAVGVVAFALYFGSLPFFHTEPVPLFDMIRSQPLRMPCDNDNDVDVTDGGGIGDSGKKKGDNDDDADDAAARSEWRSLIARLLSKTPSQRPSAAAALRDAPFLRRALPSLLP
jgi:serine/threonine protein kinase